MKKMILISFVFLTSFAYGAEEVRCINGLVKIGDSRVEAGEKCLQLVQSESGEEGWDTYKIRGWLYTFEYAGGRIVHIARKNDL